MMGVELVEHTEDSMKHFNEVDDQMILVTYESGKKIMVAIPTRHPYIQSDVDVIGLNLVFGGHYE